MTRWTTIARRDEIAPDTRRCVEVESTRIVLFHHQGQFFAVEDLCPHAGMPLAESDLQGLTITCPYHAYCFDLRTGRNIDYPQDPAARVFPVRVQGDDVQVELPDDEA